MRWNRTSSDNQSPRCASLYFKNDLGQPFYFRHFQICVNITYGQLLTDWVIQEMTQSLNRVE